MIECIQQLTVTIRCYPATFSVSARFSIWSYFCLTCLLFGQFLPLTVCFTLFFFLFFLCGDACSSRWTMLWALSFHGCTLSVLWSSAPFSFLTWFWVCWAGKHLPLFADRDLLLYIRPEGLCSCLCYCLLTSDFWAPVGQRRHRMGNTMDLFC